MKTVYKYELPPIIDHRRGWFMMQLPKFAKILDVRVQRGIPRLWAAVDTDQPLVNRTFALIATGEEIKLTVGSLVHWGTLHMSEGEYVFHLFEYDKQPPSNVELGWVRKPRPFA